MQDKFCLHCIVSGKVQGVFYRNATRKQAESLKVTGWVRNLADGSVEVMACGEAEQVWALHEWLRQGPPKALVSGVKHEKLEWSEFSQFTIR